MGETQPAFPTPPPTGAPRIDHHIRRPLHDRLFGDVHNFWTCYPDGRDPRAPHGNYGGSAISVLGIKPIPGAPGQFMAIGGEHHADHSGNLLIIDINRPDRSPGNLDYFWPSAQRIGDTRSYKERRVRQRAFWSEITPPSGLFVVGPEGTRILLVDRFGTETMLFDAREVLGTMAGPSPVTGGKALPLDGPQGDFLPVRYPTLVRQRPRPPVIPVQTYQGARRNDAPPATVAVMNVYDSDFTWPPGTKITALRVIQVLPKSWPWTSGIDTPPIGWSSGAIARMPLGTVPVEADGSVYSEAPTERLIYFQALNADGLAVQSMRSGTYVHPGERLSCAGCHEDKWKQHAPTAAPLALRRPPSQIAPEAGGVEPVNYWRLAKPVFDAKCTGCHVERGKGIRFEYTSSPELPSNNKGINRPLAERVVFFSAAWGNGFHSAGPLGAGNQHRTVAGKFGAMGSPLLNRRIPVPRHAAIAVIWVCTSFP